MEKKVAIVTGGARGIGKACCLALAKSGVNIVFTYNKSKKEADNLKKQLKDSGVDCLGIQTDITDYNQCRQVVEKTLEKFEFLDILVNNAGIIRDRALAMMMLDDWKEVIDTNLNGMFNMTKASIITFLKQKKGCIINISSVSGLVGVPRQTNYSASKAGIIGFSKSLAREVAAYNIRVNVICPGYTDTDMLAGLHENIKKEILDKIPMKRLAKPEEIGDLCDFLASDKAGYITGEAIKIDGGLTA